MTENTPLYITIGVLTILNIYLVVKLWDSKEDFSLFKSLSERQISELYKIFDNHNNRIIEADKKANKTTNEIIGNHLYCMSKITENSNDFSDLVLYCTVMIAAHQTEIENLKRRRK